jgi:RNA polymerase sigma factor (sigma-70 family)
MAEPALDGVLRQLRRLTRTQEAPDRSDRDLLERFVRWRDQDAFAALVQRHGPTVLGVCRRVVGNAHDAEDAFQAAFLVLARKAGSIRRCTSLPCWLHGVAYRVAANLRRGIRRRRSRESLLEAEPPAAANGHVTWNEVQSALDEELARLPERYRLPLVLCYLDGKTRDEAARHLGWGLGTFRGRLERGRALLRARLTRRGLTLPAALAAVALAPDRSAAVPPALLSATVQAARAVAAGEMTTTISAEVIALSNGVSRTMFPLSSRLVAGFLLAASILGTGAGVLSQHLSGPVPRPEVAEPAAQAPDAERPKDDKLQQEVDRLRQENERLHREVQKVTYRLEMLEAERALGKITGAEVHFKGKALSYWLEQLRDRDATTRFEAVRALAAIGEVDPQVIPVLGATLKDRNSDVQLEAVKALAHIGEENRKAIPVLARGVKEGSLEVRTRALRALGDLGDPKTIPTFIEALGAKDDGVRAEAAQALGPFGPQASAAVPALVRALRQDKLEVRAWAALTLLRIGPDAVPAVSEVLQEPDRERRFCALVALAGGGAKAVPFLAAALKDPDHDIRASAAQYLGVIGNRDKSEPRQIVVGLLPTRGQTVTLLGADVREAVPFLERVLKDRDTNIRAMAAEALGKIGPDARAALPALLRLWEGKDDSPSVGVLTAVFKALWQIDPIAAARARVSVQGLNQRLPGRFRQWAGGAPPGAAGPAVPIEVKRAIPILIQALADKDPDTRAGAATALGEIGPDAAAAIPALKRALQDENEAVRVAAAKALNRMRDP